MKHTANSLAVMSRLYLRRDKDQNVIESPEQAINRVAVCVAGVETTSTKRKHWGEVFFRMIDTGLFMPNTPTWTGSGRENGQLMACFVLPVPDSIGGIFDAVRNGALVHQSGGGTGYSFGRVRESGSLVNTTNGIASGPLSFMTVFDEATETIKQGSTRRGANMGCLPINHPDIKEFITCKTRHDVCKVCDTRPPFSNFNLSVLVTDDFMEALATGATEFALLSPSSGDVVDVVNPKELWALIVQQAWTNGEPGIIFIDNINAANPTPELGDIEATNPCGETPLLPYEACTLGSINLAAHVVWDTDAHAYAIDWELLKSTVKNAVRFLDNVIDASGYPLEEIKIHVKDTRKIGLGVMGFADICILLNIPYASGKAIALAKDLGRLIQDTAFEASCDLADERSPFPAIDKSIWKDTPRKPRNATRTTIAPTGTISRVAGCSSGIEPIFGVSYVKVLHEGARLTEVNDALLTELGKLGLDKDDELLNRIKTAGILRDIPEIPDSLKSVFQTSTEIPHEWHLRMQAAWQENTDNAVSKTINMANEATEADVDAAYRLAHKIGLKGMTVYRNDSRSEQPQNLGIKAAPADAQKVEQPEGEGDGALFTRDGKVDVIPVKSYNLIRPRGKKSSGNTWKMRTGCGNLYVTVNHDEQGPAEIFINMGDSGGCVMAWAQAFAKTISLFMRAGYDARDLVPKLRNIRCPEPLFSEDGKILSCPCAIAMVLEHELGTNGSTHTSPRNPCSRCGAMMIAEEGCFTCPACGESGCG